MTVLGIPPAGTATLAATGMAVLRPAAIEVPWSALGDAAQSMADCAGRLACSVQEASHSWQAVRQHYAEPETQEMLWSALDAVPDETEAWARVWTFAAGALQDFVLAGRPLQQRADALTRHAAELESQLAHPALTAGSEGDGDAAAEEALHRRILQHNEEVTAVNDAWQTLQADTEERLAVLESHGGTADAIPEAYADGGSPAVAGAHPTWSGGRLSFNVGTGSAAHFGHVGGAPSLAFAPGFALAAVLSTLQRDPVKKAEDLYEAATGPDYSVEDVQDFYDHVTTMSAEEITDFAADNPQVNRGNLPTPSSQEELDGWPDGAEWWQEKLDEDQQEALIAYLPLITGNTEGVPYKDRSQANKNALNELVDSSSTPEEHIPYLQNIQDSLIGDEDGGDSERLLLSLNIGVTGVDEHPPLASVSVGNPDDAEQTVFNAPGMNSGTDKMTQDHEPGEVEHAQDIYNELVTDAAVVAWVGYHAPQDDSTVSRDSVLLPNSADEGSWTLAHALDGYHDTLAGQGRDSGQLDVLAHSYGTNMSIHALTRTEHPVDSFIAFGSSGYPDGLVEDNDLSNLNVKESVDGHPAVYATDGFWDWTSNLGRWHVGVNNNDPADPGSGAYVFDSDGTGLYVDGSQIDGEGVTGHSRHDGSDGDFGYLDSDAQAFLTKMDILNGRHEEISWIAEPDDDGRWRAEHDYPSRLVDRSLTDTWDELTDTWDELTERFPWNEEQE